MNPLLLRIALVGGVLLVASLGAAGQATRPLPAASTAASTGSPGTIGAMQGTEPTPATGASTPAPKLVRKTPGNRDVTQPRQAGDRGGSNTAASGAAASATGH